MSSTKTGAFENAYEFQIPNVEEYSDSEEDYSEDDSENRRYIQEQMRLKQELEAKYAVQEGGGTILSDGDYDSSDDESENQKYIEQQMRLKKANEAKFAEEDRIRRECEQMMQSNMDYYSDEEESSSDGEYIRQQLALAAKRQQDDEDEFEDESEEFDPSKVKEDWLKNKGDAKTPNPPEMLKIVSTSVTSPGVNVLVDYVSEVSKPPMKKLGSNLVVPNSSQIGI